MPLLICKSELSAECCLSFSLPGADSLKCALLTGTSIFKSNSCTLRNTYSAASGVIEAPRIKRTYAEVISCNKKNLERELQNESRQHNKHQSKTKRRGDCKIMRNWYLLFGTSQILYSYCHIPYNGNREGDFYEYEYYIEILTVFA